MKELDKENLHKEIDLVQACITRMANNSFLIKGWAISLIAVVLALVDKDIEILIICLILLIPAIGFWWLDSFFLYTEKLYRELYKWVITERMNNNSDKMYDLNPHRFRAQLFQKDKSGSIKLNKKGIQLLESQKSVMVSPTLLSFYGLITSLLFAIGLASLCINIKKDDHQKVEISKMPAISPQIINIHLDSVSQNIKIDANSLCAPKSPKQMSSK